MRRAGAPLAYSGGYSPRPLLRFGPPVPVGYEARSEYVDADLEQRPILDDFVQSLSRAMPAGLEVLAAEFVDLRGRSLMSAARAADYVVMLETPPPDLRSRVADFLAREVAQATVSRGPKTKTVDIRLAVEELALEAGNRLRMRLVLGGTGTCRPEDVAHQMSLNITYVTRTKVHYDFSNPVPSSGE